MSDFLAKKLSEIDETLANAMQVVTGVVTKVSPLEIQVSDKLFLTSDFIKLTSAVKKYQLKIDGVLMTIDNSLRIGDSVLMLKQQGGQIYYILDKEYAP